MTNGFYYLGGMLGNIIAAYGVIALAIVIATIVACWKINEKAGEAGWSAIVPFYSSYIRCKITWGNGWYFVIPYICGVLTGIPVLGMIAIIVAIVFEVLTTHKLSQAFGHDVGFTIGLIFLNTIFVLILGFGKDEYAGVPTKGNGFAKEDNVRTNPQNININVTVSGNDVQDAEVVGEKSANSFEENNND